MVFFVYFIKCILIADFNLDEEDPDFYSEYGILKKNSKIGEKLLTEDLEIYILELKKLKKKLEKSEEIDNKKLVSWLKFISNPNELEEDEMNEEEIQKAIEILEDINSSENERDLAERRLDFYYWQEDGKHIAREEGMVEGLTKGKMEIAKKLLCKNMSIEDIVEITGLTKEEIEKLK